MLDKNTHDYSHFLGKNIVGDGAAKCPFDRPPNNAQDYKVYRQFYEDQMQEITNGQAVIKISVNCEGKDAKLRPIRMRKQKPEHFGCHWVFACHHVIHQDPENPEGVTFVPFMRDGQQGFYVCATCLKMFEHYKLNMDSICAKCSQCVLESVEQILLKKPDRVRDYRLVK